MNVPVVLLVGRNSPGFLGEMANWLPHCRRSKWSRYRAHAASTSERSNGGLVKLEDSCIGHWVAFLKAHALLSSLVLSGDKVRGPPRL